MNHLPKIVTLVFFSVMLAACSKNNDTAPAPVPPPVTPPVTTASITDVTTTGGITGGPKNTVITINGTNFITDTTKISVTVNGNRCALVSAAAGAIKAIIPANCGTGNIVLTLNGTVLNGPVFNYSYTYTVISITNGLVGFQDGVIATAKWDEAIAIATDSNNTIYTSGFNRPSVRMITADMLNVSTIAGSRTKGDINAQGINAQFGLVNYLSVDKNGNIFFADASVNKIKKIDKLGNVTTFIATPIANARTAKVDKQGNVYVLSGDAIAKYNAAGTLQWEFNSHGAGSVDGDTSVVKFNVIAATSITLDNAEDNLYYTTINFNSTGFPSEIKKLDLQTLLTTTVAGMANTAGSADGSAASATFKVASGLAFDKQGGLYIADAFNDKIRYLKNGTVSTLIGAGGYGDVDGDVSTAKIFNPQSLAVTNKGDLIISCYFKNNLNDKLKKLVID